ncbi:MAG: DUF1810 domain-containing protein [Verrucomicrobiales bacterium]
MNSPSINDDPFNLSRFLDAQEQVYQAALKELSRGLKQSHWMWFIFPQFKGLGRSETASFYAIKSVEEAKAYLAHPVLGKHLEECSDAVLRIEGRTAHDILGSPDDLKLHSSMTLFDFVSPPTAVYKRVLAKYFSGQVDHKTLGLLE